MLYAVSVPNTCLSYSRNPCFGPIHFAPTRTRRLGVSASLPETNGAAKVEYTPWLIVGLGNPGNKYHGTRHNCRFYRRGSNFVGKPQAYMNFSGESVGPLAEYYQVPLRHILLVYDEMSLPNGVLRLQPKGGHGYHNGVKSVMEHLDGCREFPRYWKSTWYHGHESISPPEVQFSGVRAGGRSIGTRG